jgi:3,4-dihydroxy 2-butanone 4-phosphate synthase / GTP cyclohydrolase II
MLKVVRRGRVAIVLINDGRRMALSDRVSNCSPHSRPSPQLREYGIGAQILVDIRIKDMIMLSNREQTLVGIEGYGLTVVGQEPV